MDNVVDDFNIYYPVEFKEDAYKIYNLAEQGYSVEDKDWGVPRKSPLGINSAGNFGEHVDKWLFIIKYAKKKNKGAKSAFKAYVRSESNGRWLGILPNGDVTTVDEDSRVMWTFIPIGGKNYVMSTEEGKSLSYKDKLFVSYHDDKVKLILDRVY